MDKWMQSKISNSPPTLGQVEFFRLYHAASRSYKYNSRCITVSEFLVQSKRDQIFLESTLVLTWIFSFTSQLEEIFLKKGFWNTMLEV